VIGEEDSTGPTLIEIMDSRDRIGEKPIIESQEEKAQEQNREIEQVQEKSRISKGNQRRRITSYLSDISKQVESQGNQINKMTMMIQLLQRQNQTKSTTGAGIEATCNYPTSFIQKYLKHFT
ncbi:MAG: hypothetical protein ACRD8Z_23885, partial [Nitrososphaeraceae archaeon]